MYTTHCGCYQPRGFSPQPLNAHRQSWKQQNQNHRSPWASLQWPRSSWAWGISLGWQVLFVRNASTVEPRHLQYLGERQHSLPCQFKERLGKILHLGVTRPSLVIKIVGVHGAGIPASPGSRWTPSDSFIEKKNAITTLLRTETVLKCYCKHSLIAEICSSKKLIKPLFPFWLPWQV